MLHVMLGLLPIQNSVCSFFLNIQQYLTYRRTMCINIINSIYMKILILNYLY